jgi:hypothetical protein
MKSKLQNEIESSFRWLRDSARFVWWNCKTHQPVYLYNLLADRRLPIYFFGMVCEAAELYLQAVLTSYKIALPIFGIPYPDPLGDAIVGFILMIIIMIYQGRPKKKV